jgi:hypothetical protein
MTLAPLEIRKCERFSEEDKHFRFQLRRWWTERPERWVAWLMLNPSEAGRNKPSDPTIDDVICFSHGWGFDGCIVVNLYPFVSSVSREGGSLHLWRNEQVKHHGDGWFEQVVEMQKNLLEIEYAGHFTTRRVVAFGGKIKSKDKDWVRQCVNAFEHSSGDTRENLKCVHFVGTHKDHPAHPHPRPWQEIPEGSRTNPPDWTKRPKWLS